MNLKLATLTLLCTYVVGASNDSTGLRMKGADTDTARWVSWGGRGGGQKKQGQPAPSTPAPTLPPTPAPTSGGGGGGQKGQAAPSSNSDCREYIISLNVTKLRDA